MIYARALRKAFRAQSGATVCAVDGVDLDVTAGEVVGFLGPNGAGKTTIQRMLTTILPLDEGIAQVAGCDVRRDPVGVRRNIGYVGQTGGGATECRLREELIHHGRLHGLRGSRLHRRVDGVLDQLGLEALAHRRGTELSGGQRRRFEIALGLVHAPPLLFLDEPTTGLDPQSRADLWQQITDMRAQGTTVFLTTHYLDEADALCDRLLVIDHGRIVAEGQPEKLKADLGDVVTAYVAPDDTWTALRTAREWPVASNVTMTDGWLRCSVWSGAGGELVGALHSSGVAVHDLAVHRPTLDDVFLTLTGRRLREPGLEPEPTDRSTHDQLGPWADDSSQDPITTGDLE